MSIHLNKDIFEDYIAKYPLEKDANNVLAAEIRVYGFLFYCGQCNKEFYYTYPYRMGDYTFTLTEHQIEEQRFAHNIEETCKKDVRHIVVSGRCPICNRQESFGRKGYSFGIDSAELLWAFREYSREQQVKCIKEIYESMRKDRELRSEKEEIVNTEKDPKELRRILYTVAGIIAVFLIVWLITWGLGQYKRIKRDQIIERWKTDGCVDYMNAREFENAVNNGEKVDGKIVTFSVREIHPDSLLGYNLWAGEHLNFVSDNNPEVEVGEEITVLVTDVKKILRSYKITYIMLEK